MSLFALFGPPAITLLLFAVGAMPYALWVTRRKPSRPARWALIGCAAAMAAYAAGTLYGLAFTHPLDLCGDRTGSGAYMDAGRDHSLTSVNVNHFPPSVTCHWSSGDSSDAGWFWTTPLLYAGLGCALVCCALLLDNRVAPRRSRADTVLSRDLRVGRRGGRRCRSRPARWR